ncbi:MAG: hypothetical protein EOM50_12980 [Erysipelotrichia bacterium]|nr:hypothetical protein [Erysipelotrichia bacterium]
MKFYYVALTINPEQPVKTLGGRRLAYYNELYQAVYQCKALNNSVLGWREVIKSQNKELPYKVYCVESEPTEVK